MILNGSEVQLLGSNFLINIALPEYDGSGLKIVNRDPRKQRLKPACYVGKIEEVGTRCQYVKVGDTVVFERWEWQQLNVDSERLVARERDLIILDGDKPMPDIIVMQIINVDRPKTTLYLPGVRWVDDNKPYYHGIVERLPSNRSVLSIDGERVMIGDELIVEAYESGQYKDGKGRLFFKLGKIAHVMAILQRAKEKEFEFAVA